MRKGKISFAWTDDDPELNLPLKPALSKTTESNKPAFDVSQIRDRVMQMEMGEEVILDAVETETILAAAAAAEEEEPENDELQALRVKQAKEARAKSRLQVDADADAEEFIGIGLTEHRLRRDFDASEEAFNAHANSRFVREDLVTDLDDTAAAAAAVEGLTPLPILSRRLLLARDLKSTEFYDAQVREKHAEDSDEEVANWQAAQARKGIEKGWRSTRGAEFDASEFLAKQSRLALQFTAPKAIDPGHSIDALVAEEARQLEILKTELEALEENCAKMRLDAQNCDFTRFSTDADQVDLARRRAFSARCTRWTAFLAARERELNALSQQSSAPHLAFDAWEHFFDDVDGVDEDEFLNLPAVCAQFQEFFPEAEEALVCIISFFCKYHLLKLKLDPALGEQSREEILHSSGLHSVLMSLPSQTRLQIENKL
jgi:hypothetical protein